MSEQADNGRSRWADAWPDALAFATGLAMAWYFQWQTRDLVWSLWLSSLLVGYAMIVWGIFGPGVSLATKVWSGRAESGPKSAVPLVAGGAVLLVGAVPAAGRSSSRRHARRWVAST